MRTVLSSIESEFRRYKRLGEDALRQLDAASLVRRPPGEGNSAAMIVWHVAGNLRSRFTDFLASDGEKPWRDRESEFAAREVAPAAVLAKWEEGWQVVFSVLDGLTDDDLHKVVTIRQQPLAIHQALHRSLAHTSYHVGQIVFLAKSFRGASWRSLSIPKGASNSFMQRGDPIQKSATPTRG